MQIDLVKGAGRLWEDLTGSLYNHRNWEHSYKIRGDKITGYSKMRWSLSAYMLEKYWPEFPKGAIGTSSVAMWNDQRDVVPKNLHKKIASAIKSVARKSVKQNRSRWEDIMEEGFKTSGVSAAVDKTTTYVETNHGAGRPGHIFLDLSFEGSGIVEPSAARVATRTKTAGFSSWKCLGCHRSLLSMMAVDEHLTPKQAWMTDAVAIPEGGKLIKGEYDGYGKVGSKRLNYQDNISCWHEACWKKSGSPGYTRPSQNADDQGWFFEPRKYLSASPTGRDTAPPEHLKRPEDEGEDMSRWSDHQKIRKELMWKFEIKDPKVLWESIMVGLECNRTSQYHFFVLWQDKDTGEYVGGNAYGSFGNSPKSVLLMRDADQGKVEKKVKSKMRSKSRKYAPKDELIPNAWRPKWGSLELASASRVAELATRYAAAKTAGGAKKWVQYYAEQQIEGLLEMAEYDGWPPTRKKINDAVTDAGEVFWYDLQHGEVAGEQGDLIDVLKELRYPLNKIKVQDIWADDIPEYGSPEYKTYKWREIPITETPDPEDALQGLDSDTGEFSNQARSLMEKELARAIPALIKKTKAPAHAKTASTYWAVAFNTPVGDLAMPSDWFTDRAEDKYEFAQIGDGEYPMLERDTFDFSEVTVGPGRFSKDDEWEVKIIEKLLKARIIDKRDAEDAFR
jgi:hypothetical protein